jgi:hypothetical protein
MNEEQLRAAITQAISDNQIDVVNELTPLLQRAEQEGVDAAQRATGAYVPDRTMGTSLTDAGAAVGQSVEDLKALDVQQREQYEQGNIGTSQMAANVLGKGGLDVLKTGIGETIKLAGKSVLVNAVPDSVERFVAEKAIATVDALASNPVIDGFIRKVATAGEGAMEMWQKFKEENPNDALTVQAVINVAEFANPPPLRAPISAAAKPTFLGTAGDALYESGIKKKTKATREGLHKIITPILTTEVLKERVPRMKPNKYGTNVYTPSVDEEEIVSAMMELDLNTNASLVENYNAITAAVDKKRKYLDKRLAKSPVRLNKKQLIDELKDIADELQEVSPALTGDAKASANKIWKLGSKLVRETDGSPAAILNVRRQLDSELKKIGKVGWADGKQSGIDIAIRSIRNHLNLKVAEAVPDVEVKTQLRKMHLWLKGSDNVLDKAGPEADMKVGRMLQNIERGTGTPAPKSAMSKYIAASAVAGLAAQYAGVLPSFAAIVASGTVSYMIARQAISPAARKSLSKVLKEADAAIRATKNADMKKALAADRAFIVELMQLPTTQADDQIEEGT